MSSSTESSRAPRRGSFGDPRCHARALECQDSPCLNALQRLVLIGVRGSNETVRFLGRCDSRVRADGVHAAAAQRGSRATVRQANDVNSADRAPTQPNPLVSCPPPPQPVLVTVAAGRLSGRLLMANTSLC
jgi:hypothetical protein